MKLMYVMEKEYRLVIPFSIRQAFPMRPVLEYREENETNHIHQIGSCR